MPEIELFTCNYFLKDRDKVVINNSLTNGKDASYSESKIATVSTDIYKWIQFEVKSPSSSRFKIYDTEMRQYIGGQTDNSF